MRFHLLGLPHTQMTRAYSNCAFTQLARKMANMMTDLGHEVFLYGSEENEARVKEHITCITRDEQAEFARVTGPETVLNARHDSHAPHVAKFVSRAVPAIKARLQHRDIILISSGRTFIDLVSHFPNHILCEYAVGYEGWLENSKRVMPSYAWYHALYGKYYGANGTRGRFYDRVIPHYFDEDDYTYVDTKDKEDYLLFVGRLNVDKGVQIAIDTAKALDKDLVIAGQGPFPIPSWVENVGLVGPEKRNELMSKAKAVFVPSLYLEPFGKVVVEAHLCGTPTITTDFGSFPELVRNGQNGQRCNTMKDFVDAANCACSGFHDSASINAFAESRYSTKAIGPIYEKYYQELLTLFEAGFYTGYSGK